MADLKCTPIVALDFPTAAPALDLVERLGELCSYYKVGSELFTAAGPELIAKLREAGSRVFLDLKFHDIPNTVAGAVRSAAAAGASMLTVHAGGGEPMLRAAEEAASNGGNPQCMILGVTVLTSLGERELQSVWGRTETLDMEDEVLRLADLCRSAGLYGVVCSGKEAAALRARYGDSLATLVPGIRFAGAEVQDQARVVTPADAARAGARYIVLGRAVTGATDPEAAMARVWEELGTEEGVGNV